MDWSSVEQPIEVSGFDESPQSKRWLPRSPQVTRLRDRFIWRQWYIIWIGEPFIDPCIHQLGKFIRIEAKQSQDRSSLPASRQLNRQQS